MVSCHCLLGLLIRLSAQCQQSHSCSNSLLIVRVVWLAERLTGPRHNIVFKQTNNSRWIMHGNVSQQGEKTLMMRWILQSSEDHFAELKETNHCSSRHFARRILTFLNDACRLSLGSLLRLISKPSRFNWRSSSFSFWLSKSAIDVRSRSLWFKAAERICFSAQRFVSNDRRTVRVCSSVDVDFYERQGNRHSI